MKLHLGCGEQHFNGYVNIDYPSSEHSVQLTSGADEFANLLELKYKVGTIEEIRLHHVFEHFQRATACALLASWNSWLKIGGILRIEVPDFEKTGKVALSRFSSKKQKAVAIRHIFGSQEAHWAVHYHGYTTSSLSELLKLFGFEVKKILRNQHMGTYNIEIIAVKKISMIGADVSKNTSLYLSEFLVAEVESEREQLKAWMEEYQKQVQKTFAVE